MLRFASFVFIARDSGVRGFAIGTLLCPNSIEAYRFPPKARVRPGDYHLTWRAVEPDSQGRGIGTALVDCRISHAQSLGCRAIHGHTDQLNYPTRRLLVSRGFVECARLFLTDAQRLTSRIYYSCQWEVSDAG
jgi:GNAT superfamily N-acetyltransferase